MEASELTIKLEQRDWERLQRISERNGEPMEKLAARFLAADLAKIFNKPPDIPWNSKTRQVYESFVEGRTQTKEVIHHETVIESQESFGSPQLNLE